MFERLRQPVFSKRPAPEATDSSPAIEPDLPAADEPTQAAESGVAGETAPVESASSSAASVPSGEPAASPVAPFAEESPAPVQSWQEPVHEQPAVPAAPVVPVQSWQEPVHEEPAVPVAPASADPGGEAENTVAAAVVATAGRKTRGRQEKKQRGAARGQERPLIGLDIEPGLLVAVKSRLHGRLEVEQAAYLPIGLDVVRDGEVTDVAALAEALGQLFETSRLDRRVRIGIANQRIMMRRIELPPLTDADEIENTVDPQARPHHAQRAANAG